MNDKVNFTIRKAPKIDVLRALFARSGNQCAFPGCVQPLVNPKNQFIGQLCHIEGALPGGQRYNKHQTEEERREYNNLILLCYPHHIETNDVLTYTVETLKAIKFKHESSFMKDDFKIDESELFKIINEMNDYWAKIERFNTVEHSFAEFAFSINVKGTILEVMDNCHENIRHVQRLFEILKLSDEKLVEDFKTLLISNQISIEFINKIHHCENKFESRNWELHNMGVPNLMKRLEIDFCHIEIKYIEEYLKTNSKDLNARNRLDKLKSKFSDLAKNALIVD